MSTEGDVERYLAESAGRYEVGQDEYYARDALEQALMAHREGNYGIGAVAVVVEDGEVREFPNRNAMFTGTGLVDHAETRALLDIRNGVEPTRTYARTTNQWTVRLPEGVSVYGSLEPCPMCTCVLTNGGVRRSVSTVLDGELKEEGGWRFSAGAANAIGEKGRLQPQVWRWIQGEIGITFELLDTPDTELVTFTTRIFEDYREEVDRRLAERGSIKRP
jgi:tRNA(Arg) A34 adenosine deaminase TadA